MRNHNPSVIFSHKQELTIITAYRNYCTLHIEIIGLRYGYMILQKQRNPIPIHFIEHGIEHQIVK